MCSSSIIVGSVSVSFSSELIFEFPQDAEAKTQKRSRSESSTSNEHSYLGDIPYEGVPIAAKARSRKNIGGEVHIPFLELFDIRTPN